MTDGSNIDDILKSIDALLKEGHEEQRRNDDVIDDVADNNAIGDMPDAADADEQTPEMEVPDEISDQVEISILPDVAGDDESIDESIVQKVESAGEGESEHADGGVSVVGEKQPDEQSNEQNEPAGQQNERISGKRILLSADMQVQDGPELPLHVSVQAAQTEVREAPESATADASLSVVDEALVARISAEICTALQRQLPEIIAPLVSEALRRHSGSGAAHEHRE
ncbi:MAG: hypothetical protein Q9M25_05745 [Mariprofundaceae bacterium]|nr:hypothetical protein [Mariprofundaceae bacterium]